MSEEYDDIDDIPYVEMPHKRVATFVMVEQSQFERMQSELIEARKLIAKLRHLKFAHYNDFIAAFGEYDGWREEMGYDDD